MTWRNLGTKYFRLKGKNTQTQKTTTTIAGTETNTYSRISRKVRKKKERVETTWEKCSQFKLNREGAQHFGFLF